MGVTPMSEYDIEEVDDDEEPALHQHHKVVESDD